MLLSTFDYEFDVWSIIFVCNLQIGKCLKIEKYYQGEKEIDNNRCKEIENGWWEKKNKKEKKEN